jgi:hypothetical protein
MKTKAILLLYLKLFLFAEIIFLSSLTVKAQTQKGNEIDGEAAGDGSGFSISMADTSTIAIGASGNGDNGITAGQVRVFYWKDSTWFQKGADIDGEQTKDLFGSSVSMADVNTIAIGAPSYRGANKLGYTKVYRWNGSSWVQKGAKINGDASNTLTGHSVSMGDSNTFAISAIYRDGQGFQDNGRVRVYYWNGTGWLQKGADIWGESSGDASGYSISMPDKNTIAIGAPGNSNGKGHVRVYFWNNYEWVQKGEDIDGVLSNDQLGSSVSMPDSNIIAIGAEGNGLTRVFRWSGTEWIKVGADINGGNRVSMPNSNTISIGYPADFGIVKIFTWTGTTWKKIGRDILGEATGDRSGYSICMPSENMVAIGAPDNDGTAANAGHVRIYALHPCTTTSSSISKSACFSYISPSTKYNWNNSGTYKDTIPNTAGCDSIITITLTIHNVDISVTNSSPTIIANANGATYQWLDCNNNFVKINGANTKTFLATSNGNYAVQVTQNGCTDTSLCINVSNTSILENTFENYFKLFPNPTRGEINLELGTNNNNISLILRNAIGQVVLRKSYNSANSLIIDIPGNPGIYILEVTAQDKKAMFKVLKK